MYEVIYDIEDPIFPTSATKEFETLEEAAEFAESLKGCDYYTNIQIVSKEDEYGQA